MNLAYCGRLILVMSYDYTKRPLLVYHYERYLVDQNVGAFMRSISSSYTIGGLERVANSPDPAARRGAVLRAGEARRLSQQLRAGALPG